MQDPHLPNTSSAAEAQRIWMRCAQNIRGQVSDAVWRTTFSFAEATTFNHNSLTISVPTAMHRNRIEKHYRSLVAEALDDTTPGATLLIRVEPPQVESDIAPEVPAEHTEPSTPGAHQPSGADWSTESHAAGGPRTGSDLGPARTGAPRDDNDTHPQPAGPRTGHPPGDPSTISETYHGSETHRGTSNYSDGFNLDLIDQRFTFNNFMTGTSNQFAHAAAMQVASRRACPYNPLFIYGASGNGKTHLLKAIVHEASKTFPSGQVRYLTTEAFLNEFAAAIRTSNQPSFKQKYRTCAILLLDDVQFLQKKDGLQEELFHTFNDILHHGGQVVLSSDRPPDEIRTLESRLRSRFRSGLMTDIQPPEHATRLAILQYRTQASGVGVSSEVLSFIAQNITQCVRDLQGALTKIIAYSELNNTSCSLAKAEELLADIITMRHVSPITVDRVLEAATRTFQVSIEELLGRNRSQPLATVRQVVMYVARIETNLSYPMIGRHFGDRDHTTVLHAYRKIDSEIKTRPEVAAQVRNLQDTLKYQSTP